MPNLINLERKFSERKDTSPLKPTSDWNTLLEKNAVIILGDAGSGKTSEFELQHKTLRSQNRTAFLVRLDELAEDEFQNLLTKTDSEDFDKWKNNQEEAAYFFLDGADEQQTIRKDFSKALRKLKRKLPSDFHSRSHFFFSSRAQEWTESRNREALKQFLTPAQETQALNSPSNLTIDTYDLLPLEKDQIILLVRHFLRKSSSATRSFLKEIERRNLWYHFGRPLDVEAQLDFWNKDERFGNLVEITQYSVELKCKESNPLRSLNLAQETLHDSIEKIALAGICTNQFSFTDPKSKHDPQNLILKTLHNLNDNQKQEIISLPVFATTSKNAFRFHHRSTQHYLAARCILSLVKEKGLSQNKLQKLFFRESILQEYEGSFVPSHLRATIAWLSLLDAEIRKRVINETPEVLLESGEIELVSRSISFELLLGPLSIPLPVDGPARFTEVLEKHVCVVLQCLKGFYALPT